MSDLITRLRQFDTQYRSPFDGDETLTVYQEAADEIERQRAEIEQLRSDRDSYKRSANEYAERAARAEALLDLARRDCFICGGDGKVYDDKCDNCDGTGIQPETTKDSLDPGSGRQYNCPRCGDPFPSREEGHDHYMHCRYVPEKRSD